MTYVSSAADKFSDAELNNLLEKSRSNNVLKGITGMLLYCDGDFIQTLEGKKEVLDELYQIISKDPRHRYIIKVAEGFQPERKFQNWSMGFQVFQPEELSHILGFKSFDRKNLFQEVDWEDNHPAVIVMRSFYENQPVHRKS